MSWGQWLRPNRAEWQCQVLSTWLSAKWARTDLLSKPRITQKLSTFSKKISYHLKPGSLQLSLKTIHAKMQLRKLNNTLGRHGTLNLKFRNVAYTYTYSLINKPQIHTIPLDCGIKLVPWILCDKLLKYILVTPDTWFQPQVHVAHWDCWYYRKWHFWLYIYVWSTTVALNKPANSQCHIYYKAQVQFS